MPTTRRSPRPALLALVAVLALGAAGCGATAAGGLGRADGGGGSGGGGGFDPGTTRVVVAFDDSSVPPQYHRSYRITVRDRKAHVVVDSYGTVLHDETVTIAAADWDRFVGGLHGQLAGIDQPEDPRPCPGGTVLDVAITSGSTRFHRNIPACNEHDRDLDDRLDAVLAPIAEAVHLDALTATD